MDIGYGRTRSWVAWILSIFLVTACATDAPVLNPVGATVGTEAAPDQLTVLVKPIVTTGVGNEERRRLGIDLSAYFSAFEVSVVNRTSKSVALESEQAVVLDSDRILYHALQEEEALDYYRYGEQDPERTIVLVPKARQILKKDADRLRDLRLRSVSIPAGHFMKGVLLFRKVPKDRCDPVTLKIEGLRITGEEANREFTFRFSCPPDS